MGASEPEQVIELFCKLFNSNDLDGLIDNLYEDDAVLIPEPGAAPAGAKPAASTAEATALVKKIQDFVGGKAAIDAVQSVRMTGTMSRVTPQGPMDIEVDMLTKYPDAHRNVIKSPNGEMIFVSTASPGRIETSTETPRPSVVDHDRDKPRQVKLYACRT